MVVDCQHVWNEISNYLDHQVDAATRAAMEAHFRVCKHCTAVLDGTRNVVQLYGDDRLFELPAGFSRRLQRRLAAQTTSAPGRFRSIWMLAVAAIALIVGGLTLGGPAVFRYVGMRSKLAQPPHRIPDAMMVAVSSEGKVFHAPGCKFLHLREGESPQLMSASEALKEGYAPCARCLRQYLSTRLECPRLSPSPEISANIPDDLRQIVGSKAFIKQ
jgi:hypothetical protein